MCHEIGWRLFTDEANFSECYYKFQLALILEEDMSRVTLLIPIYQYSSLL